MDRQTRIYREVPTSSRIKYWKREGDDPHGQENRDNDARGAKPPLAALDTGHARVERSRSGGRHRFSGFTTLDSDRL